MIGQHVHGSYAQFIAVPARNAVHLPNGIPFEEGATLMCASATASLVDMARRKVLDTSSVDSQTIPLDADKINKRLDELENFASDVRAVIVPYLG